MNDDHHTSANFRNSEAAKTEVAIFLAWMRSQEALTKEEKEKFSLLADRYLHRRRG